MKSSRAWALALTATATMAVSYVDRQTLAVLAPTVTKDLGISSEQYGDLLSAFAFAYLIGAPIAGRLLDAVGARKGLLGAVIVWSAVAALHALAPSFAVLFALRIALGLSEAPSFPGAAQTMQRALPEKNRSTGFGILFTGSSFGAMIAPPLATFLEGRYGYRVAFVGTALVGLAWVPLWLAVAFTPEARAVLDVPAEKRHRTSARELFALLRSPAVLRLIIVVIASAPFLNLCFNWGALYLERDHGISQAGVSKYLWLPPLVFDVGAIGFGVLASRWAVRTGKLVPPFTMVIAGLLAATGALTPFAGGPLASMLVISVALAGGAGLYGLATSDALGRIPKDLVSTVGGIAAAAQSIAQIVANKFVIPRSVDGTGHYTQILLILGAWVIPGTLVWLLWTPPDPPKEEVAVI